MGTRIHQVLGLATLVAALAFVGCGAPQAGEGTIAVASSPVGEVFIDGTSYGTSPVTATLPAGSHEVKVVREKFETFTTSVDVKGGTTETLDVGLTTTLFDDPEVLLALAQVHDIEWTPFEEPERHRGSGSSKALTIVWPQRDIRMVGLKSFCIEASADYDFNGTLVFKKGRKVLYSAPFQPETMTTVAAIPAEVLDAVKNGDKITWGVEFDRKRDNITSSFKIVKSTKAERGLEKLENSKHFRRQSPLTQDLLRAAKLENYRLYSEALVANLDILTRHPESIQPFRGIVTTLRRLDGKNTSLWDIASEFVSGRGGRARPGDGGIGSVDRTEAGREIDMDVATNRAGAPAAVAGYVPRTLGAGDSVAPGPQRENESTDDPTTPEVDVPAGQPTEDLIHHAREVQREADTLAQLAKEHAERADEAEKDLAAATKTAEEARAEAERLEGQLRDAQEKYENALPHEKDAAREEFERMQAEEAEARAQAEDAEALAAAARDELEGLRQLEQEANQQAEALQHLAQEARNDAERAGVEIPDMVETDQQVQERERNEERTKLVATLLQDAEAARRQKNEADAALAAVKAMHAGNPPQELLEQAEQMVQAANDNLAAIQGALQAAGAPGAEPSDPEQPDPWDRSSSQLLDGLEQRVEEAENAHQIAQERLASLEEWAAANPGDPSVHDLLEQARAQAAKTGMAYDAAQDTYENAKAMFEQD